VEECSSGLRDERDGILEDQRVVLADPEEHLFEEAVCFDG
jgi:hypothetical protein